MKVKTVLLTCGNTIAPEKWSTKGVPRPYRLYFVKGGKAFFRAGEQELMLKKNCFYLFPSSLPFLIRQEADNRLDHIFYDFIMTPPIISTRPICAGISENEMNGLFLPVMEKTIDKFIDNRTHKNLENASAVLDSFLTVMLQEKEVNQIRDDDVLKGIEYIEANFSKQITIKEVAESVYLNEDYFIRKFKKNMGITPYAYLKVLRKNIASEFVAGGMSVADAAYKVGYQYPSSLSHTLRIKEKTEK